MTCTIFLSSHKFLMLGKYSGDLNTKISLVLEWSKRSWVSNGPVFECHLNTGQQHHLNSGHMDTVLFSNVLVQYLNGQSRTQGKIRNLKSERQKAR